MLQSCASCDYFLYNLLLTFDYILSLPQMKNWMRLDVTYLYILNFIFFTRRKSQPFQKRSNHAYFGFIMFNIHLPTYEGFLL